MGISSLLYIQLLFASLSPDLPIVDQEKSSLLAYLSAHDSVDFWTTQWDACYDQNTYKFEGAISLYGCGMIVTPDSVYTFSIQSGLVAEVKNELIAPTAIFLKDSLYIYKNTSTECPIDGDACTHAVIGIYLRRSISSEKVRELLVNGNNNLGRDKNELFGIQLSSWVSLDIPESYHFIE